MSSARERLLRRKQGYSSPETGGGGPWYDPDAVLDVEYLPTFRARWDGQDFTNEAAFNLAIGGVLASPVRTFGPYVAPGATELVTNGGFATDLTGWTSVLNGASTATVVAGVANLVSDGSTGLGANGSGISQEITTEAGEAYLTQLTRSNAAGSLRLGSSLYAVDLGSIGTTIAGVNSIAFSAAGPSTFVYPYKSAAGTAGVDNVTTKKAAPFKNFLQHGRTVRLRGTTPSVASGEKCALSFYNSATFDPAETFYNASGELHVRTRLGGVSQADLNLGVIAASTPFDLLTSAENNAFYACLLGGDILAQDVSGILPGVAFMKVADSPVASRTWGDGVVNRVTIYDDGSPQFFFSKSDPAMALFGDSMIGGAWGVVLPEIIAARGHTVYMNGVGGTTMNLISAALVAAAPEIKELPTAVWDGDQNGFVSVQNYCDLLSTGLAGYPKIIAIPPCTDRLQADTSVEEAVRDEYLARWPNNTLDWRNVLVMNGAVPADSMFEKTDGSDNTHLNAAAMNLMATAIEAFVAGKGWWPN